MTDGSDDRRSAIDAALQAGLEKLRAADLEPATRVWARVALRLSKGRDADTALESVGRLQRDLRCLQDVVDNVYESGLAAERDEAERSPYQEAWQSLRRRSLGRLAEPGERRRQWLDCWMDAVADAAWPAALGIVGWYREWPEPLDRTAAKLHDEMLSITHELSAGQHPTISAVDSLLRYSDLSARTRIRVSVLKSRTLLLRHGNPREAAELMRKAARRVPENDSVLRALVQAVRAEIALKVGNLDTAKRHVQDVQPVDEPIADRIVAAGLIALTEQEWARASDLFDAAANRFGTSLEDRRLLAEAPPDLVLAVGRSLRDDDPAGAADRYRKALEAELTSPVATRKAWREYADVLSGLGRLPEAAEAYASAGRLYSAKVGPRALEAWERAHELDPGNASYCWAYGEEVRFDATTTHGIADTERLLQAKELLEEGTRIAGAGAVPGWVMISRGLIAHSLGEEPDPAAWIERGILLDGPNANNCALLAWLHRLKGFTRAAERAARFGAEHDRVIDRYLAEQWMGCLVDLGLYGDALQVVEDPRTDMSDAQRALWRGWIIWRNGEAEDALAVLDEADDGSVDVTGLQMACYETLRDEGRLKAVAEMVLEERDESTEDDIGWAYYALGRLDEAIDRLEAQYQRFPRHHTGRVNLGLVLLARGDDGRGDIDRGRTVLLDAIKHSTLADELAQLLDLYLDQVAERFGGVRTDALHRALQEARLAARDRIATLRSQEPDPESLSQRLAAARHRRYDGEPTAALSHYAELSRRDGLPEAATAVRDVACALIAEGDRDLAEGHFESAYETWRSVATNLEATDAVACAPDDLAARLGFSELERGGVDAPHAIARLREAPAANLVEAVPLFARDLDLAWRYHDSLVTLAERIPGEKEKFESSAAAVPFDRLLRLHGSDATSYSFSPAARACEVLLAKNFADQADSFDLTEPIAALRKRVKNQYGLSIPGVRVAANTDESSSPVTFRIFEQAVAELDAEPGSDPGPAVMKRLAEIVSDNLFRWISADDLELWNCGWNAQGKPIADLPDDLIERVRLTRVLRALLSEGIPIKDRRAIVDGFRAGSASDSVSIMTEVRRGVYPLITGNNQIWQLPAELEAAIGSALDPGHTTMTRARARELCDELRSWREGAVDGAPATIAVRETALRPFVWHLLSADRPRIYVVAREEIPAGERPS